MRSIPKLQAQVIIPLVRWLLVLPAALVGFGIAIFLTQGIFVDRTDPIHPQVGIPWIWMCGVIGAVVVAALMVPPYCALVAVILSLGLGGLTLLAGPLKPNSDSEFSLFYNWQCFGAAVASILIVHTIERLSIRWSREARVI